MTRKPDPHDAALMDLLPLYRDTQTMLRRLMLRVEDDLLSETHADIRWLHGRVVRIERAAQERDAKKREATR